MIASSPDPRTYDEFFAAESRDPYQGQYRTLLNVFRVDQNPPTHQQLYQLVADASPQYPAAFLTMCSDSTGTLRYNVVFGTCKYPALLGQPTQWDNQVFAFHGDIIEGGTITTVTFPADAFRYHRILGTQQNVPSTLARARELLEANPDVPYLDALADSEANIRQTRTRGYVPLPHIFVRQLLDQRPTVREGFIDLSLRLEALGDPNDCPELVNWLLCSITADTAGNPPSLGRSLPVVPLADRALHLHRRGVLKTHLTGFEAVASSNTATQEVLATAASALTSIAQDNHLARVEARERAFEASNPKTVAQVFGKDMVSTLLCWCNVEDEISLPPFWRDLAAVGVKQDRATLQAAVMTKGRLAGRATATPIITGDLVKKATSLAWAGHSTDDLSEGIQPFVFILHDYAHSDLSVEAQRQAEVYDVMQTSSITSSLQDAQAVKKSKAVIPRDLSEARAQLVASLLVWAVLVGDEHPFVQALGTFVQQYSDGEFIYQNLLKALHTEVPAGAILLRSVQIATVNYWRSAFYFHRLPQPPDFTTILTNLDSRTTGWIPSIPPRYWKPVVKPAPPRSGSAVPSLSEGPTSGNASNKESGPKQTPDKNPSISPSLAPFDDSIRKTPLGIALKKGGPPPEVNRNGSLTPMCLAYHLKGKCWSGCSRREDHGPHSTAEDKKLVEWCQVAFEA